MKWITDNINRIINKIDKEIIKVELKLKKKKLMYLAKFAKSKMVIKLKKEKKMLKDSRNSFNKKLTISETTKKTKWDLLVEQQNKSK